MIFIICISFLLAIAFIMFLLHSQLKENQEIVFNCALALLIIIFSLLLMAITIFFIEDTSCESKCRPQYFHVIERVCFCETENNIFKVYEEK
jgi:predicted ferric reductase